MPKLAFPPPKTPKNNARFWHILSHTQGFNRPSERKKWAYDERYPQHGENMLAVKCGPFLPHQDLRAARSILWLRRNGRQHRPVHQPAKGRSSVQTLLAAVCPTAAESACRSPSYRSAVYQAAACLAALQGHGRHSDAARG